MRHIQNDTETEVRVVEATIDYMNYMYTVYLPALQSIVDELKLRQAAYQTLLQGYLPSSLIPPTMLAEIVSNANEKLREKKLKFAVSNLEFLYTMEIATVHRVRRSLYVTLLLPVTRRILMGYFHLYIVNTYSVPTDHDPDTHVSTCIMDMPPYFASQYDQYLEVSQETFDSCIQDGHMYHCPFDLPISYHRRQCPGAVFYERHQNILEYCRFQINPVYEGEIVQEVRPGEYLMSTGNQTWGRDCPNGTEYIDSCTF